MKRLAFWRDQAVPIVLVMGAAGLAALLACRSGLPDLVQYGAALLAAMAAIWIWLAFSVLATRRLVATSDEVRELLRLQRSQTEFQRKAWRMLERHGAAIRLLRVRAPLQAVEERLDALAGSLLAFERLSSNLARWRAAAADWRALAAPILPEIGSTPQEVGPAELEAARAALPAGANLSSRDLKLALAFLAEKALLDEARSRFARYGEELAGGPDGSG